MRLIRGEQGAALPHGGRLGREPPAECGSGSFCLSECWQLSRSCAIEINAPATTSYFESGRMRLLFSAVIDADFRTCSSLCSKLQSFRSVLIGGAVSTWNLSSWGSLGRKERPPPYTWLSAVFTTKASWENCRLRWDGRFSGYQEQQLGAPLLMNTCLLHFVKTRALYWNVPEACGKNRLKTRNWKMLYNESVRCKRTAHVSAFINIKLENSADYKQETGCDTQCLTKELL